MTFQKKTERITEESIGVSQPESPQTTNGFIDNNNIKEEQSAAEEKRVDQVQYDSPPAVDPNNLTQAETDRFFGWKIEMTKKTLAKQPKVRIMIPKREGDREAYHPVGINGYFLYIKKGVFVDVPAQIANMIADSFELTLNAGKEALIENLGEKIDPETGKPKSATLGL